MLKVKNGNKMEEGSDQLHIQSKAQRYRADILSGSEVGDETEVALFSECLSKTPLARHRGTLYLAL